MLVARVLWSFCKWILVGLLIVLVVGFVANLLAAQTKDVSTMVFVSVLRWLFLPGLHLAMTLSVIAVYCTVALVSGLAVTFDAYWQGGRALKAYVRYQFKRSNEVSPKGFAPHPAMSPVNVPLHDVFIHLHAVSDRPRYEDPAEQMRQFERVRLRTDLPEEERAILLEQLGKRYYAELGRSGGEGRMAREVRVEEVIGSLDGRHPGAVILGAPGSGKSTTMNWFAYHMARAYLLPPALRAFYRLIRLVNRITDRSFFEKALPPDELIPYQVPVLLRIGAYAVALDGTPNRTLPFEHYLLDYFKQEYATLPGLPERILREIQRGHCLLLLDGLDEVATDDLRRRVATRIAQFIEQYSASAGARHGNRFLVTSRIVGFTEVAAHFSRYVNYTLQELTDEQIERFLDDWCPAFERYQKFALQGKKRLSPLERGEAQRAGMDEHNRLWQAMQNNPGIKRLAVNPLMLTMLALIQRGGRTLPHRRIELYQTVTETMLNNWNKDTGRRFFSEAELPLAKQLLMHFAYQLHSKEFLLTETRVKALARPLMRAFYEAEPTESAIEQCIKTLRSSSSLFIEIGQGLFTFLHRTFQEYYVALYLKSTMAETGGLRAFLRQHCHDAIWHEPFLLLIADKSGGDEEQQREARALIELIADETGPYDAILQRHLLLATSCLIDCNAWSVKTELPRRIANGLFDLYGDTVGAGRYTELRKDIERLALLWLKGQPTDSESTPPLLEAWRAALCDPTNPQRQQGAVHLLASIAPDLHDCPKLVLNALLPPLLHLADVVDMSYPPEEIRTQLSRLAAKASSIQIEEYAFVALRLLEDKGPAGWLHTQWLTWSKEQPQLLERLTRHALEIGTLLTPTALPALYNENYKKQGKLRENWQKRARRNHSGLQQQLLAASTTASFPHAHLYWYMLKQEETTAAKGVSWRVLWQTSLQKEMQHARSSTYQASLTLLLQLCQTNEQRQHIADDLVAVLSTPGSSHLLVTINIFNSIYLRGLRDICDILDLHELRVILEFISLRGLRVFRGLRGLLIVYALRGLIVLSDLRDLREIRVLLGLRDLLELLELLDLRGLRGLFNKEKIILSLKKLLTNENSSNLASTLFCLYNILSAFDPVPAEISQQVAEVIQTVEHTYTLAAQERLLLAAIRRRVSDSSDLKHPPAITATHSADELATALSALQDSSKNSSPPKLQDMREIIDALSDTRDVSEKKWAEIMNVSVEDVYSPRTVASLAWTLLSQSFTLPADTLTAIIEELDSKNALVCAASALLLQHARGISRQARDAAGRKIMQLLADEERWSRPLDPLGDPNRIWRLDDMLFETLRVLAE